MRLYGYTIAIKGDPVNMAKHFQRLLKQYRELIGQKEGVKVERGGMAIDGFFEIEKPWYDREAGGKLRRQLVAGDIIVFLNVERVFRKRDEIFTVLRKLKDKGIRVIIADWRIDTGTPAGKAVVDMLREFHRFAKKRTQLIKMPKLV